MPRTVALRSFPRISASLRLILAVALLLAARAWAGDDFERWYTLEMGGKRAGYMHAVQRTVGDQITSETKLVIAFGRGDAAVKIEMAGSFVETKDGRPVSMRSSQELAKTPMVTTYTFGEDAIAIKSEQAGRTTADTAPLPEGSWLPPAAASEYVRQRLAAGAEKIVVRSMDPLTGAAPTTTTRTGVKKVETEVMGKRVSAFECTAVSSANPSIESVEVLDEEGIAVRSTANMGPFAITIVAATRAAALAEAEAPEVMVRTFVKPDRRIERARELESATYLLSIPSGEMPELPGTGAQRVEAVGRSSARVTIATSGGAAADPKDAEDRTLLASSPMLNHEDERVSELVKKALVGAGESPKERAQALRGFVHRHINRKDLGVGFASASEVARTRQGDCTEHATLLAAMLRGAGIPSRVVSGLIYADEFAGEREIFGYHMWAQGLMEVGGRLTWVDLDPTLPGAAFDATHIALSVSSLPDADASKSLSGLVPLLGRLEIKVENAAGSNP
jgi:transglutaminase-like putative cysteine protease